MIGRIPKSLFLGFLSLAVCLSAFAGEARETLTLSESVDRALKNNPKIMIDKKDLSVAQTQQRQAKSLFYPRLSLNLDYIRYRNETVGLTERDLGNTVLEAPIAATRGGARGSPLAENLYIGQVGFVQPLFNGGKIVATHKLSQANVKRAENELETARKDIEFETTRNFYRLVSLKEKILVVSETMLAVEKLAKVSSDFHSKTILAIKKEEYRRKKSELILELEKANYHYLQSMGVELYSAIDVEGELDSSFKSPPDLQTVLVWSKQNRTDLKNTEVQKNADQLSIQLSLAQSHPVFLLGGGVEVRNSEFPLKETNWNTALSLNVPLFDGFSSRARVKESRYRADQGRLRAVQLEDRIEEEVRSSYGDYLHWGDEIEIREKNVLDLKSKQDDYLRTQKIPLEQKMEYLHWRTDAELDYIEAKFQLSQTRARLARATGKPMSRP